MHAHSLGLDMWGLLVDVKLIYTLRLISLEKKKKKKNKRKKLKMFPGF